MGEYFAEFIITETVEYIDNVKELGVGRQPMEENSARPFVLQKSARINCAASCPDELLSWCSKIQIKLLSFLAL